MERERFSRGKSVMAVDTQTIASATTTNGEWINTQGFDSLTLSGYANITTGSITAITWDEADLDNQSDSALMDDSFNLYEQDSTGAFKEITGDATTHNFRVGCVSKKKWVRPKITTLGTVSIVVFAMAELGDSKSSPDSTASSTVTPEA